LSGIGGENSVAKRGTKAQIDPNELERLAALHCTDEEIAAWFGISTRTVERHRKNPTFAETIARGRAKGKISLRRTQMRLAEQGNPALAIWLGKQLLGQVDHIAHDINSAQIMIVCPAGQREVATSLEPDTVTIDIGSRRGDCLPALPAGKLSNET
jgi:hypothetical protein